MPSERVSSYILFTPGPVTLSEKVKRELSRSLVYHREENFSEILGKLFENLKLIFKTKGRVFIFTSSGTGAMEAAVVNLVSPKESVLVTSCGKFGERWEGICKRFGADVHTLKVEYGKAIPAGLLEEEIKKHPSARFIFTTLTETSTGVLNDIKSFGRISRNYGKILIVDAIAGLGADEFWMDRWGVDVAVGGSQKALGAPPGLSLLAVNNRAWEAVKASKSPRYYWDLPTYEKFSRRGQTPYTPAITITYGLALTTQRLVRIGIEKSWEEHKKRASYFRKLLKRFQFFPERPSNALTVIKLPSKINGTSVIKKIKRRYKILFADGQGKLKGKIIRVGHMGDIKKRDLKRVTEILREEVTL